jgi:DNA repair protein RecO (recombination protein O)
MDRFENFHLLFLVQLTRFFGFQPTDFGEFAQQLGLSATESIKDGFSILLENKEPTVMSSKDRKYLLEAILDFYKLHIEGFKKMSSNKILHEVLK